MRSLVRGNFFFRIVAVSGLTLLFMQISLVRAAENVSVSIAFDQSALVIGRTGKLTIDIVNLEANSIRATKFQCLVEGSAASPSSISQLPYTIAPNTRFTTEQFYRGASAGTTLVHCELTAINNATGALFTVSSPTLSIQVLGETRLYFNAYASTNLLNVGETVVVTALYGNRGNTTFANVTISCVELGRSLVFVSQTPVQSTLPPGRSLFTQYTLRAERSGSGPIACSITATDSSGAQVTLPAPTVNIQVR